jgi:hypothetical protein
MTLEPVSIIDFAKELLSIKKAAEHFIYHILIQVLVRNNFESIRSMYKKIRELAHSPEIRTRTVSEFWAIHVPPGISRIEQGISIQIDLGVLLPYGPLIPAHPLCRPAYSPQGWDLVDSNRGLRTGGTPDYDVLDNLLYADRVIRVPPHKNKYYAGLYDHHYGLSIVGFPLLIDEAIVKKHPDLLLMWQIGKHATGLPARVQGNLQQVETDYPRLELIPKQYRGLPSYGLEVTKIELLKLGPGVTHGAAPVDWLWRGREQELAHYFNLQDLHQFEYVEAMLDSMRKRHSKRLLFDYDDVSVWKKGGRRIPEYNGMLKNWFDNEL